MMRLVACALMALVLGGCGKPAAVAVEEPSTVAAVGPAVAANELTAAQLSQQAVGTWCLRSMTHGAAKPVLDGSSWELNADGTYAWAAEITTRGTWTLTPETLRLSHGGEYDVVQLSADHMLVSRMGVQFQLYRDCGPEIAQARRLSALRKAAEKGDLLMVGALIDQGGIDISQADPFHVLQHTPLIAAIERAHVQVVALLLKHGASVTALSGMDKSVFESARRTGNAELTRMLTAQLTEPRSLDVPAVLEKADGSACPANYVELLFKCVHTYALPRPTLNADVAAIVRGAPSPLLRDWAQDVQPEATPVAAEVKPVSDRHDFSDLSKLDPAALMRKGSPMVSDTPRPATTAPEAPARVPGSTRKRMSDYLKPNARNEASAAEKSWVTQYTGSDGKFDEAKFKRELCAQYRPALQRVRAGELPPGAAAMGMTQADAIAAIEANIRACSGQ